MSAPRTDSSPPRAIASVIASMALLAVGNGLMMAFVPVRLSEAGLPTWVAGITVTAMGAGGLVACLLTGRLVRRVNHARAFSALVAGVILSVLMIAPSTHAPSWIAARALFGFANTALFIVSQSWLNDACVNAWRGRVISLFFLMQLGLIAVQYPLGALSDRMDRRYTLVGGCALVVIASACAATVDLERFWLVAVVFAVWAGATESIYSIANAYANDRAEPEFYVSLSSTLQVAWSLSSLVLPAVTTALMPAYGPGTFIYMITAVAALYAVFVTYRLSRREAVPPEETGAYLQVSAQAPLGPGLASPSDEGTT